MKPTENPPTDGVPPHKPDALLAVGCVVFLAGGSVAVLLWLTRYLGNDDLEIAQAARRALVAAAVGLGALALAVVRLFALGRGKEWAFQLTAERDPTHSADLEATHPWVHRLFAVAAAVGILVAMPRLARESEYRNIRVEYARGAILGLLLLAIVASEAAIRARPLVAGLPSLPARIGLAAGLVLTIAGLGWVYFPAVGLPSPLEGPFTWSGPAETIVEILFLGGIGLFAWARRRKGSAAAVEP